MIVLERVGKSFDVAGSKVVALEDVDLSVATGEFLVVRGASGSGKSTLLALIGGLSRPTSGRVVVAGRDLGQLGSAALAEYRAAAVGFVFQAFHLVPYLDVVQNVALGSAVGHQRDARRQAQALLDRFGLSHRVRHVPSQLSVGECQRVAIARAILKRPQLLLADEPTGNLDAANADAVLAMLEAFHAEGGTVVLATHFDGGRLAQWPARTLCQGRFHAGVGAAQDSL